MKVLVIDDEAGVRRTLSMILEDEGYQVITASDGKEGLDRALKEEPDLILCDIRMPRMDGLEFMKRMQSNDAYASIPVIEVEHVYIAYYSGWCWKTSPCRWIGGSSSVSSGPTAPARPPC